MVVTMNHIWGIHTLVNSFFFQFGLGLTCGSAGKESACNVGDLGSIPGLGRSPGEGKGYPLQYSGLESSMDCIVCGVAKSLTRLTDFHFTFFTTSATWESHKLEKWKVKEESNLTSKNANIIFKMKVPWI